MGFDMGGMGGSMSMGTSAIAKVFTAVKQFQAAKVARAEAERLNKPKKTPFPIIQNSLMAKNMAGSYGLPGQNNIQNQLDADTSNAVSNLTDTQQSPAAIAAAVMTMYKNQMQQDAKIGIAAANNKQALTQQLMGQNNVEAQYIEKNFDHNVTQPFHRALNEAAFMEGAAMENSNKAVTEQGAAIGSLFGGSGKAAGGDINSGIEQPVQGGDYASNTGFNNNQTSPGWGGNAGPQGQAWGGMGGKSSMPQIDEDQILNYRIKTGDKDSSDYEIYGKLFNSAYSINK